MANRFDIDEAFDGQAPETIVIGDYLLWKRTDLVDDYPLATHSHGICCADHRRRQH